jgi:hypothetical protein
MVEIKPKMESPDAGVNLDNIVKMHVSILRLLLK